MVRRRPPHGRPKKEKAKVKNPEGDDIEDDEDSGLLPLVVKDEAVDTRELFPKAGKTSPQAHDRRGPAGRYAERWQGT